MEEIHQEALSQRICKIIFSNFGFKGFGGQKAYIRSPVMKKKACREFPECASFRTRGAIFYFFPVFADGRKRFFGSLLDIIISNFGGL